MKKYSLAAPFTLALLLAGCGGGGGSSSSDPAPAPEPTPPPVEEIPPGFSISGRVNVSPNLSVDSDTNNPEGPSEENNSVATAQPISNPTTLGGYVSQPGAGESGAIGSGGDIDDYFRVELLAGQTITLLVADFEQADADLYLYSLDGQPLDSSIETGQLESLVIPADGTYVVNVFAFFGATNYTLAIGTNNAPAGAASKRFTGEIIPWEAVVRHLDSGESDSSPDSTDDLGPRMGMRYLTGGRYSGGRRAGGKHRARLLAMEHTNISARQRLNRLGRAHTKNIQLQDPRAQARWETLMAIKTLRREPGIASAEPNYRVRAMAVPDDEAYPFQWHYPLINLPAAWDLTTGEPQVVVAVIDTGILRGHPDLAGQLVAGYVFISNPQRARDGNGIDPNPEDVGDGEELGSSSFHGTHVSGTIAAASNNSIGVTGVAWNARIMPLRVLGVDGGSSYDVEHAVRYAAGLANDSGTTPAQRAQIINLSLGGTPFNQFTQALFDEVRAAGVIVVAAAGNEASSVLSYPASYNGVISVSAVDSQRQATPYSNFGSRVDIAAPGGNNGVDLNGDGYPDGILSTGGSVSGTGVINFVYSFLNGTSMASPHVAGVMALMKSVNPDLSPADIDSLLAQGELTDELGAPGRDNQFGHGLVNAERAVVAALTAAGTQPEDNPHLGASSARLNFGSAAVSLNLVLQNSGRGDLEIVEITGSEPWLEIVADNTDGSGLGTYQVIIDREELPVGVYSATISAESNINTVNIEVLVSVLDEATGGDVGLIYLLLIDTNTQEAVAQFDASAATNFYGFEFINIPPGTYELFVGSDADNDLFICDPGEACGAYLTLDQPVLIELTADLEALDFPIEYRVTIPTSNGLSVPGKIAVKSGFTRMR